ncbi:MAG: hypothetical protein LC115_10335 [Bacteroidia bacterium]|nr:hypothetical protein [Bacteroidia bacterium]
MSQKKDLMPPEHDFIAVQMGKNHQTQKTFLLLPYNYKNIKNKKYVGIYANL